MVFSHFRKYFEFVSQFSYLIFQMIKNITEQHFADTTKWKILSYIGSIIEQFSPRSYIQVFTFVVVSIFFQMTIFFKAPFFHLQKDNLILSEDAGLLLALGQNWNKLLGLDEVTFISQMVAIHFFAQILNIIGCSTYNRTVSKFSGIYYFTYIMFFVPLSNLGCSCLKSVIDILKSEQIQSYEWILKLILSLLIFFTLCQVLLFSFYSFRPLRKQNMAWKLSSTPDFLRIFLGIIRTYILTWSGISLIPIFIGLFLEIWIIKFEKEEYPAFQINKCISIYNLSKYSVLNIQFVIVCSFLVGDHEVALKMLLSISALILINCIMNFSEIAYTEKKLPYCKQENCESFYSFYFDWISKAKNHNEDQLEMILIWHKLSCNKQDCEFQIEWAEGEVIDYHILGSRISRLLKKYRFNSPYAEILYELWNYQVNFKFSLRNKSRQFSPEHEFIVHFITAEKLKISNSRQNDEASYGFGQIQSKEKFNLLEFFSQVIACYERLYGELDKPRPRLSVITRDMQKIYSLSGNIDKKVDDLYSMKKLDFVLIQLYFAFIENFPVRSKTSIDLKQKLSKVKIEKSNDDDIRKMGCPCLQVSAENERITQFNKEAMKLLQVKRFQIRDKKLEDIIEPPISLSEILNFTRLKENQSEKVQVFLRKSSSKNSTQQNQCRSIYIHVIKRYFSECQNYMVLFEYKTFRPNEIEILVNVETFDFILADKKTIVISSQQQILDPQEQIRVDVKKFYQKRLKKMFSQMNKNKKKINREVFEENNGILSIFAAEKNFPKNGIKCFSIIYTSKKKENDCKTSYRVSMSTLCLKNNKFAFSYDQDQLKRLVLLGKTEGKSEEAVSKQIFSHFSVQLNCNTFDRLIFSKICLPIENQNKKDIKTYRLYKGQLFNVDLQDKSAYEKIFDKNVPIFIDQFYEKKKTNVFMKVLMGIILLILLTDYFIVEQLFFRNLNTISDLNDSAKKMQLFSLEISRINNIFRDISNGLFQQYQLDFAEKINISLLRAQKYSSETVFDAKVSYKVKYKQKMIEGNLNQLYQYAMSQYQSLVKQLDYDLLQRLHDLIILQLNPLTQAQRYQKHREIQQINQNTINIAYGCAYFFIVFLALLIVILLYMLEAYTSRLGSKIKPLLLFSESKLCKLIEQTQKFKDYILMIEKKNEANFTQTENFQKNYKQRKRPKHILMGWRAAIWQIFLGAIFILFAFIVLNIGLFVVKMSLEKISKMVLEEEAIINSYLSISEVSNQINHSGSIPSGLYEIIGKQITLLEKQKSNFEFSEELASDISEAIYYDSCGYAVNKGFLQSKSNCSNSLPGFIIQNPFELGLILFLRDQHYNLLNNLTDTFGSTGIFSLPFIQVTIDLGERCYQETSSFAKQLSAGMNILFEVMIVFFIVLVGGLVGIFHYYIQKQKRMEQVHRRLLDGEKGRQHQLRQMKLKRTK